MELPRTTRDGGFTPSILATPKVCAEGENDKKTRFLLKVRKKVCQVGQVGNLRVIPEKNEGL
jgi:hypothetical protein